MAGFFVGGLHTAGVLCTPAANILITTRLVATLGAIWYPGWVAARWQIFLIFQALSLLTMAAIKFGFRFINWITNIASTSF